jgi:hypothetical protein
LTIIRPQIINDSALGSITTTGPAKFKMFGVMSARPLPERVGAYVAK